MAATTTPETAGPDAFATPSPEPVRRTRARHSLDEDDRKRARWEVAIGWIIVAICTWLVFSIMNPNHDWVIHIIHKHAWSYKLQFHAPRFGDLFKNTTTNGGDMGAHVWWPQFLEKNWFPKGRLSGWAPDWYAGFPAGQYYFPVPAVMIAIIDHIPFVPYNVAFKVVTASGPLMLPAAAYVFARGLKTPWPAPPAFAIAAFGTLVQTRTDWQIYGGNIASTLAGEFSFCIALAFALFGLGAYAYTLDTGKRRWLAPVLLALAIMSHIVVAIFIVLAAALLWLTRRPLRTWRLSFPIGGIALALASVWLLPLIAGSPYTQSMRYEKLRPKGSWKWPSWIPMFGFVKHPIEGLWNALGRPPIDTNASPPHHFSPTLWLPWWIWLLAGVAIVAAGWYRRRSTGVLLLLAAVMGFLFIEWPDDLAIWNTRFLPFWILTWAFLAAMGATEIARLVAMAVQRAYTWIRDGDLQDARARAWAEVATATDDTEISDETRKDAAWALAERRFDRAPAGWEPPPNLQPDRIAAAGRKFGAIALAVVLVLGSVFALHRAWGAADNNPSIAIRGWAAWNYSGYEEKTTWPQFSAVMKGMEQVADQHGNGRALWEPSSGNPDAINSYGTSLALELLPLYTKGKIDSMEGIYFESSATTSYHFLTVAECTRYPSNPVRGLVYGAPDQIAQNGRPADDFNMCVKHLQDLGVRYFMTWSETSQRLADAHPDLTLVATIPQNPPISAPDPDKQLKDWKVYQVKNSDLVVGMTKEPVVATTHAGDYTQCWGEPWNGAPTPAPHLGAWECTVAPWWTNSKLVDTPFSQSGPKQWQRVDGRELASVQSRVIDSPAQPSNVTRSVDKISFDVRPEDVGKPVEVRESYYPNWQVSGAKGPYRLAPNMMVVVPTSTHVTLSYGLTATDWLGRFGTVLGLVGLVLFALWAGATRYAGGADVDVDGPPPAGDDDGDGDGDAEDDAEDGAEHESGLPAAETGDDAATWGYAPPEPPERPAVEEPPDQEEPTPALP